MSKKLTIAIAGLGTVAGGLVQALQENAQWITQRLGREISIKYILVRNPDKYGSVKLPVETKLTTNPDTLIGDPEVDVFVELIGGIEYPRTLITQALNNGKHVVTANKALLAETGTELFDLANSKGLTLGYEASVCGAIPIIQVLRDSLAGNQLLSIAGIMNGTSNYILSEMSNNGLDFASALKQAQELGYAEADPTLDIEGFDTAHKLNLLIRLAWGVHYPYAKLPVAGVSKIESIDIHFAKELGYRIKLLGQARIQDGKLEAEVAPALVRNTMLIASVEGAFNAVHVQGNASGSLFFHGKGAGALPTASAVLSDLVNIARGTNASNMGFVEDNIQKAEILPNEEAKGRHYFRFMVSDKPGVLRDVAAAMADNNISVAQAIQKSATNDDSAVPLVFMTHEATVGDVKRALTQIKKAGILHSEPLHCRIIE
ncbi:homoserine dehydrogenase [Desulfovibrio litoralis]|uniref:Homoserine dehydrogenase n=1 Tax=Desulfovibrio litoralis DSM 11393 TaxID=1121455 RepID=A0A1M7S6T9_9BACT|nr:homoserine dehydrogenase [Desulfovibrio litoralis]SHN54399.1 homoserine dehydrogenase [Desulfovibrio litoralis DSM 11393]